MTSLKPARNVPSWLDGLIAILTLALMVVIAFFADQDSRRVEPPEPMAQSRRKVSRPEWVWEFHPYYRRFQFDYQFALTVATLGTGLILAKTRGTWTKRGMSRPGTLAVAIAVVIGVPQIAMLVVERSPSFQWNNSVWYDIYNNLAFRNAGTILGAWVVLLSCGLWRRAQTWQETLGRVIGWGWLGTIVLLLGYPLLFG